MEICESFRRVRTSFVRTVVFSGGRFANRPYKKDMKKNLRFSCRSSMRCAQLPSGGRQAERTLLKTFVVFVFFFVLQFFQAGGLPTAPTKKT
jgi:hypothetical protein